MQNIAILWALMIGTTEAASYDVQPITSARLDVVANIWLTAGTSTAPTGRGRPRPAFATAAYLVWPAALAAGPRVVNFIVPPCWVGGVNQKPFLSGCPGRQRQSLGAPCSATMRLRMVPTSSTVTSMPSPGGIPTGAFRSNPPAPC